MIKAAVSSKARMMQRLFLFGLFGPALFGVVAGTLIESISGFFDKFNGLV